MSKCGIATLCHSYLNGRIAYFDILRFLVRYSIFPWFLVRHSIFNRRRLASPITNPVLSSPLPPWLRRAEHKPSTADYDRHHIPLRSSTRTRTLTGAPSDRNEESLPGSLAMPNHRPRAATFARSGSNAGHTATSSAPRKFPMRRKQQWKRLWPGGPADTTRLSTGCPELRKAISSATPRPIRRQMRPPCRIKSSPPYYSPHAANPNEAATRSRNDKTRRR
jgi:hypothetical protein